MIHPQLVILHARMEESAMVKEPEPGAYVPMAMKGLSVNKVI